MNDKKILDEQMKLKLQQEEYIKETKLENDRKQLQIIYQQEILMKKVSYEFIFDSFIRFLFIDLNLNVFYLIYVCFVI